MMIRHLSVESLVSNLTLKIPIVSEYLFKIYTSLLGQVHQDLQYTSGTILLCILLAIYIPNLSQWFGK